MREPLTVTYEIAQCYVHDNTSLLPPEIASKILGWIRSRYLRGLASCSDLFMSEYHDVNVLRSLMQVEAFFKKNKAMISNKALPRRAALRSFSTAERQCEETNTRIDLYCLGHHNGDFELEIERSRRYINRILGSYTTYMESIPSRVRVTAGASASHSRRSCVPYLKLERAMEGTHSCEPYFIALERYHGGIGQGFEVSSACANRVEFVPKNWKTERTIACEPEANLLFQLTFDDYVKDRLRKRGIDLSDQSKNRELARKGSIDGSLATIDLSMASDTLSYNTVHLLLPHEWARYLSDVRSPLYRISSKIRRYHKFSSMGNGATFALETLIFASACYAVGGKDFSVYGDDIIIETELFDRLQAYLAFLGFSVNEAKTYGSGPFRESCGGNYFLGTDITPFYIRDLTRRKTDWAHLVNGLVRIGYPGSSLWSYARELTRELDLLIGPFTEDSTAYVWIPFADAKDRDLVRWRYTRDAKRLYMYATKRYIMKTPMHDVSNSSGSLALWYISKMRLVHRKPLAPQALAPSPSIAKAIRGIGYNVVETSRANADSHKYVRRWALWFVPSESTPLMLYAWADYLFGD